MTEKEFEDAVIEGMDMIPQRILDKTKNLQICIEDRPSREQLEKLKNKRGDLILGLYEGIPQTERGYYSFAFPDKITIFKKSIEKIAKDEREIKKIVKETVWHELAHHFGFSEKGIQIISKKRK